MATRKRASEPQLTTEPGETVMDEVDEEDEEEARHEEHAGGGASAAQLHPDS